MVAMSVWATTVFSIMKVQDGLCLLWIDYYAKYSLQWRRR